MKGAYAVVAMVAGHGMLAFRDPHGIRPLIIGRADTDKGVEFLVASESVTLDTLGFKVMRDVAPAGPIRASTHAATSAVAVSVLVIPCSPRGSDQPTTLRIACQLRELR